MSHDFHPPQSRSHVALVALIIVLAALVSAASVGVVAGQAQNGTNASGTGQSASAPASETPTATPATNRLRGSTSQRGQNTTTPTTAAQTGSGNTTNFTGLAGDSSAGLDGDATLGDIAPNRTNGSGGNASGNGSGDGGGGVLGTLGAAAGGAYDLGAGALDFLGGSTDEWSGRTISGFFNGAQAFFKWMLGFFIEQGIGIINDTIDKAVKAMSMTPHPNRVGNFYQNPTNEPWGSIEDTFQQTGLPLARLLWLLSLAYVMVAGNQFGIGLMSYAKEKQAWVGLALSVFFISDAGWTLTNIVPHVVDVFTQAFVQDVTTTPVMNNAAKGMVILFVLLLIYFELSAVVLLIVVAAFRILVIIGFAPFIPALVVAMYSPFGLLSWIAKAGIHLWLVLLVAAMPSALLLNASFSLAQSAGSGNMELLGTVMVIPLIVGGLLASSLMPFLLWKASSKLGAKLGGGTPGSKSSPQWRRKMSEYRDKAARPNRFQRGFRRKDPVEDEGGTRAHRAGKATRNAPRNTKRAASSAKHRATKMRNKLSKLASRS